MTDVLDLNPISDATKRDENQNFIRIQEWARGLLATLSADYIALPSGLADGDLLTWDAGTATVIGSVPPAPVSPPSGTGFRYMTAGTEDAAAKTPTAATALLNVFTALLQGMVPASGGGTSNFLRADGTWTAPTASLAITETELNFGTSPVASAHFTVTDASVSGTSKIMLTPSGNAPTSGYSDVWEWDSITFAAKAGTGDFTIYASVGTGTVSGKYKVFYTVA